MCDTNRKLLEKLDNIYQEILKVTLLHTRIFTILMFINNLLDMLSFFSMIKSKISFIIIDFAGISTCNDKVPLIKYDFIYTK